MTSTEILYLLVTGILAAAARLQFHESLPGEDLERYFGTRNKHEVPDYEIVHPVHISGSRHRRSVTSPKLPLEYHLTALGEKYHLHLNHNEELVAPGCLVTHTGEHGEEEISPCPVGDTDCYYLGTSTRHNNSTVSLSTCNGLHGLISTDSHQLLIQPIKHQHIADANARRSTNAPHLVYKLSRRTKRSCALQSTAKQIVNTSGHRVRRQAGKLYIEMLLVGDKTMFSYHGDDLVNYMLTIANVAASLYLDSTLGVPIHLTIIRLKILKDDVPELDVVPDADKTLTSFCKWQEKFNPPSDTDPLHVDAASIMTRTDLIHKGVKETTGLATLGGMCISTMRCSVLEDNGLDIGITLAHETGHSLNMNHDGDGNFCYDKTNIMSTGGAGGSTAFKWSSCSRDSLQEFIYDGKTGCLQDTPTAQTFQLPKDLPGVIYSGDKQCELFLGQGSRICEETSLVKPYGGDECSKLVCFDPNLPGQCTGSQAPRMDGTECGKRKWCISGKCTDIGPDGPPAQDGGWSAWDDHQSDCTRTCGGGVSLRRRKCNNPRPLFGGKDCQGHDTKAVMCNVQSCTTSQFHFKEEQCAATDKYPLKGVLHHWIPGDTIGDSVCMLFCQAEGMETIHLRGVGTNTMYKDGTACDSAKGTYNRCVKGKCRAFGCDGVSDSPARPDLCGVCEGHNNTCVKRKGSHFDGVEEQYVTFLTFPRGSTGIKITNDNRFTLMSISINGERIFNNNGRHRDRKDIYKRDGIKVLYAPYRPESIQIEGPIPVQIQAQVYRIYGDAYEDVTPEIYYEYYEPLHSLSSAETHDKPVPAQPDFTWKIVEGQCSVTCGPGSVSEQVVCVRSSTGQKVRSVRCDGERRPRTKTRACVKPNCPARWEVGEFGTCSKSCDGGVMSRSVQCVHNINGQDIVVSDGQCPTDKRPAQTETCGTQNCPGRWDVGEFSSCSRSCGGGVMSRSVRCVNGQDNVVDEGHCSFTTKPSRTQTCGTQDCPARWNVGEFGHCSRSCDGGLMTRSVQCVQLVNGQDRVVSDGQCPFDTRPVLTETCGTKDCPGTWRTGQWSDCSQTCGGGTRKREVTCYDSSHSNKDDDSCNQSEKPPVREACQENACIEENKNAAALCQDNTTMHCEAYTTSVCQEYKEWARKHCPKFCNLCSGQHSGATTLEEVGSEGQTSDTVKKTSTVEGVSGSDNTGGSSGKNSGDHMTNDRDPDAEGSSENRESTSTDAGGQIQTQSNKQNEGGVAGTASSRHDSVGGTCIDVLNNCHLYTQTDCRKFPKWGRRNCRQYCNYCDSNMQTQTTTAATSSSTTTAPADPNCKDVNQHCAEYEDSVCKEYEAWARTNCRHRCHFCGQTTPSDTTNTCNNVSSQCEKYPKSVCVQYKPWAEINCRQFCHFCT